MGHVARTFAVLFLSVAMAAEIRAGGQVRALTEHVSMGDGALDDCPADTMKLIILSGAKRLWEHEYCSSYGKGGARLVTDEHGRHFVLLDYSEGKGTRNTTDYLKVYEFADGVPDERVRILISEPIGIGANLKYDCSMRTPSGGGLRFECQSRIDGKVEEGESAPRSGKTIVSVM